MRPFYFVRSEVSELVVSRIPYDETCKTLDSISFIFLRHRTKAIKLVFTDFRLIHLRRVCFQEFVSSYYLSG